jgi:hypothetical protein
MGAAGRFQAQSEAVTVPHGTPLTCGNVVQHRLCQFALSSGLTGRRFNRAAPMRLLRRSTDQGDLTSIRARSRSLREVSVSGWLAPSTRSRSANVCSNSGIAWSSRPAA